MTIDIEVQCENGFPNPESAIEPLLSITVKNQQSKKIIVWGIQPYKNTREDVTYIRCPNEHDLIMEFMSFWTRTIQMLLLVGIQTSLIFLILQIESNKFVVKIK